MRIIDEHPMATLWGGTLVAILIASALIRFTETTPVLSKWPEIVGAAVVYQVLVREAIRRGRNRSKPPS
jgi:hypothetical protein